MSNDRTEIRAKGTVIRKPIKMRANEISIRLTMARHGGAYLEVTQIIEVKTDNTPDIIQETYAMMEWDILTLELP